MKSRSVLFFLSAGTIAAAIGLSAVPEASRALAQPRRNEAYITLRGLVAVAPSSSGTGVEAHFLSPKGHEHPPLLSVVVSQLKDNIDMAKVMPDRLVPLENGDAIAIWDIEKVELMKSNLINEEYHEEATDVSGEASEYDGHLPRWAPTMESVFKKRQELMDKFKPAATATFPVGRMDAVFDSAKHRRQLWDVGERKCTAVADGFRLGIELANDAAGFTLKVDTAKMKGQEIPLKLGANPTLSALPIHPTASMAHFDHFFKIRKKASGEKDPPIPTLCEGRPAPGPSFNGSRCAPSHFP